MDKKFRPIGPSRNAHYESYVKDIKFVVLEIRV